MLHRRAGAPGASAPPPPPIQTSSSGYPTSPTGASTPSKNKAYTPLRRPSTNLYNSPSPQSNMYSNPASNGNGNGNGIGIPKPARYSIPSPTPPLSSYVGGGGAPLSPPNYNYGVSGGLAAPGYGYGNGSEGAFNLGSSGGFGSGNGRIQEQLMEGVKTGLGRWKRGVEDALRLDRSWNLVWGDAELRNLVLKSTLINFLALLLLSLAPLILSPLWSTSPSRNSSPMMQDRTQQIGMWYNLLLSWPILIACFLINASWGPDISKRAQTVLHPSYRHQPSPMSTPTSGYTPSTSTSVTVSPPLLQQIISGFSRIILIADFTLLSRLIRFIPLIGRPLAFGYMCFINAYYCFEWTFTTKRWPLEHRIEYMQERVGYMFGFGLIITLMSTFGNMMVNVAVFALVYPFFVVQALLARPPVPRSSLLPSTPSPQQSLPTTPSEPGGAGANNPFFSGSSSSNNLTTGGLGGTRLAFRVPLFFFAGYILQGLQWLERAFLRDRGGTVFGLRERPGKRLM